MVDICRAGKNSRSPAARWHIWLLAAPGSQAALRVYGHRKNALEPDCDLDTELLIPMGPIDQKAFAKAWLLCMREGRPAGPEPATGKADLGIPDKPTEVLLLTDGGEDTVPHRDPITAAPIW